LAREFPPIEDLAEKARYVVVSPTCTIERLTQKHGKKRGFLLQDIPGTSGRLDILCRSALACHLTAPPESAVLFGVLGSGEDAATLYFSSLVGLRDEISLARVVKDLVLAHTGYRPDLPSEYPHIALLRYNFANLLRALHGLGDLLYLTESGQAIEATSLTPNSTFVLGSHVDLGETERRLLSHLGAKAISIGPRSYLTSHCIAYLNFIQHEREAPLNDSPSKQC
jgi:tRNA (pseudouridine54-N1)-methyltransferase